MKRFISIMAFLFFITLTIAAQQNTLTQYSTIDALLLGNYDGDMTLEEVKSYGNFGLGTFNKLDGEMIVFENKIYQVHYSGKVIELSDTIKTPFMTVTNFETDMKKECVTSTKFNDFLGLIDEMLPSGNYFYGIKITGTFKIMKTRSVPVQEKPYIPLVEVVKKQSIFDFENIEGTIIGFKAPGFVKSVNVPGYHMHFLSKDKSCGGHILDFTTDKVTIEIDKITNFKMIIPENEVFAKQDFSKDSTSDLHKVEKK